MAIEITSDSVRSLAALLAQQWAEGRQTLAKQGKAMGTSDPHLYARVAGIEDQVNQLARMSGQNPDEVKKQGLQDAAQTRDLRTIEQDLG